MINMPRFFKNIKRKEKPLVDIDQMRRDAIEVDIICRSEVNHPTADPGKHHYHVVPFIGEICCKCGMDKITGKKISGSKLATVRKSYW